MKKTLLAASFFVFVLPALAGAQEACTVEALEAAEACIENAIGVCLQGTACTSANYNALKFADTIQERLKQVCCTKKKKGQKLACLNRARSEVKMAKTILSSSQRADLLDDIKEALKNVKQTGQCMPAE